ncbi:MAG: hypothetical protein COA58_08555 [Bacteroidetes bacterium]|nr:MAG: hypothetical protein COA58_08555 [Bacteroidota bacterium]
MHNRTIRHILLGLLLLVEVAFTFGQNPIRFQNITVDNGLSMGTTTAIAKDKNGYIWIATAEGLHRYDGKYFKIFKYKEGSNNTLTDSYITSLLSHKGLLYIGNNLGNIDILNVKTERIVSLNLRTVYPEFDNRIEQIILYQNRIIIDTDGGGLWQYDPEFKKLRKVNIQLLKDQEVNRMLVDQGILYLITSTRIFKTDLTTSEKIFEDRNLSLTSIAKYGDQFLLGSKNGLYTVQNDFSNIIRIKLPPKKRLIKNIKCILTNKKVAWIGTGGGGLMRLENGAIKLYKASQRRPFSLVDDDVTSLFMDDQNTLWVLTNSGISKYSPLLNKFGLLQYFDFENKSYVGNMYFTYEDKKGTIWLGTLSSGLMKLNPDNTIAAIYPKLSDGQFQTSSVRCIFEDSKGNFWIGTGRDGIFLFDRDTEKATLIANVQNGKLKSNTIRNIYEDKKGQLWIGSEYGLSLKDSGSNTFSHYRADEINRNNSIYQIEEHPTKDLLILATFRGGLQYFNPNTMTFTVVKHDSEDSTTISNNNLMSLAWVNDDTLLIGTYGGGLNIFDLKTNKFTSISEKDGLINNAVYGIVYHGKGETWLSTNSGLVNYNLYDKSFINFKPKHYLQSTEFNEGAFLKSSNGYTYFGGVSGLNFFKPNEIKYDTSGAPVYYTDIRGQFTSKEADRLELSFLNSRLEIDFMSLYYPNPSGVEYQYRLKGFDNDWIKSKNNTAVYPRLSPGSYTFQVIAEDEFGNWSKSSDNLSIVVNPPIWQKWWFIILSISSIVGLIYALFKYRTREIERLYKLQLVDSELAALRSQMNPHFIFNSLNSIQYFILKKEPREAYTYLSKFASLMRKILQNSRLKYISVADEIEWLNLYLEMEKMRMDNNLEYSITTRNIDDVDTTNIPTMLIQPFVENSIVHGLLPKEQDRTLDVIISREKRHLLCTITDNGIGREASKIMNEKRSTKHTSAGMALTQKRLKILSEGKGDFDVKIFDIENEDGSMGTVVKLVVPIINQTD